MFKHSVLGCIVVLTLFNEFVKTHLTIHDTNHGLVSNNHEKYLVDEISSFHEELSSSVRSSTVNNINVNMLRFEPEFLDFRQRPLGVPHLEKVTLFNVDSNKSIDMTSISGSTVHFHSSFFEDKKIPPLGNTSFNVIFLGREEGVIESNLFIHTTEGHFKYQVKGASISSPYRLRPIVGIKLPLNSTFSPLIRMYNPYSEPIQIVEIYSSGGDFHLELPSGELEGPKNMWEIPPLQTKAIIRVRFSAQSEQNHTAYVRIKLNNTEDILVVPLEVEVTSTAGVYVPQGFIDFGIGGTLDSIRNMDLFVFNYLKRSVKIQNISTTSKSLKIDYENVKLPSDGNPKDKPTPIKIASLKLNWKVAFENKESSGKIVIKYKNKKTQTEIPFYITALKGGLLFNSTMTSYFINESPKQFVSRNVNIKNKFLFPLAITNASLASEAQNYFNIRNFKPSILKPEEESTIFSLSLKSQSVASNVKLNSFITLYTNVSTLKLPLLSYNGKLKVKFPYKSKDNSLDLGLLSLDTVKDVHFLVLNKNPVIVNLHKVTASLPSSRARVIGCSKGNYTLALSLDLYRNMTKCGSLSINEFAIIRLSVLAPRSEGQVWGDVTIETQFERFSVPIHYRVAQGKLEIGPDRLVFDQCFPGKICSHPLKIHSTFNEPMVIENVVGIPPDSRLGTKQLSHIMAKSTKIVGHLYLDPSVVCKNECYSSLNSDDRERWLNTLTLPSTTPELDLSLVNVFYNRYLNETANGLKRWQNLTIRLDTSKVKLRIFKTRVKMSWPSLVVNDHSSNGTIIKFPLTQVGNISYRNITVRNPSSFNLIVQLVLHHNYAGYENLNEGLPPNFIPGYSNYEFLSKEGVFFFRENLEAHNEAFKNRLQLKIHESSLSIILKPGENFTFTLGFKSQNAILNSAFLYIRNNLTVMEVLQLNGQGAIPSFKFGNRKPGAPQPLLFELTDKHLKDCEHKKYTSSSLTVKRTFTARNMGDVTILVHQFFINDHACEGFGFKILNCESFLLLPNSTKKIDIAFTPDFTSSKVVRMLSLETSLNYPVNYTLFTTIPTTYLTTCSTAIIRPSFEPYMYYTVICLILILLVVTIVLIILEAEQIVQEVKMYGTKELSNVQATFDLRSIGNQTRDEIRSKVEEPPTPPALSTDKNAEESIKENGVAQSIDLNNTKPAKQEGEKYTAVIPVVGRTKKNKLLKKSEIPEDVPKKIEAKHKNKTHNVSNNNDQDPPQNNKKKESNESNKESKKASLKKLNNRTEALIVEDESVSQTINENNNIEDIEKEVKHLKKPPTLKLASFISTKFQTNDCPKPEIKKTKKFSQERLKKDKELHENKTDSKPINEHKPKANKNNNTKEFKEKQLLTKKTSVERKLSSDNHAINNGNTVNRVSPISNYNSVWNNENKLTFSDVVARSENTPTNVIQSRSTSNPSHVQTSKPFMLVEPYKQTPIDLGPIGSTRKIDYHAETYTRSILDHQANSMSNSFFSDSHNILPESSNTFLSNWGRNSPQRMNPLQTNLAYNSTPVNTPNTDSWGQQNMNVNGTGVWNAQNTLTDFNAASSQINQESRYLWGSSTVWQPPSQSPRTPTRTPPGFQSNREIEDRYQQQHNQQYDLFGMTSMWTRQYPNPWNPPQDQ